MASIGYNNNGQTLSFKGCDGCMEIHTHRCSFTAAGVNHVAGPEGWAGVPLALMQPVSCTAEHVNLGINARLVKTAERFAVSQPTVGQSVCQRPLLSAASKEQDVCVCRCWMPALLDRQASGLHPRRSLLHIHLA